jgi:translation initiation factor 3 subunit D
LDFAAQQGVSEKNMWGIMRLFIKLFDNEPEGKYVIMRDPNRAIVRIFGVPMSTFEEDDDEDDDDEEDVDDEGQGGDGEE